MCATTSVIRRRLIAPGIPCSDQAPGALTPAKVAKVVQEWSFLGCAKSAKVAKGAKVSKSGDSGLLPGPFSNMGRPGLNLVRTGPKSGPKVSKGGDSGDSCRFAQSDDSDDSGDSGPSCSSSGLNNVGFLVLLRGSRITRNHTYPRVKNNQESHLPAGLRTP